MTLDLVIQQPAYWAILVGLIVGAKFLMRVQLIDFRMVAVLTLSQFVAHAVIATGFSELSWFCIAFWACFVGPSALLALSPLGRSGFFREGGTLRVDVPLRAQTLQTLWVTASRIFLTAYWAVHLVLIPPNFGVVAVDERLVQAANEKVMAFASPLVMPALAACMWVWLQRGYRFRWWDVLPLGLSLIGMLGSTSKVNVLPVLFAFLGVVALRRKPWREMKAALALAGAAVVVLVVRLVFYFPGGDLAVAAQTIGYRIAAATDSIDYLVRGHLDPRSYPYAGPGALFPFLTKRLGYPYEYGPGAWLYGRVRGDYSGYGPNPGILMDYFANLGWFGLAVPVLLSLLVFMLARRPSAMAASLLAVAWFACADVQLFELAVLPQLLALGILLVVVKRLEARGRLGAVEARLSRTTRPYVGRRRRSLIRRVAARLPLTARIRARVRWRPTRSMERSEDIPSPRELGGTTEQEQADIAPALR